MAILVTGGAGFIGSNLARRLLEIGNIVYVIDNLSNGSMLNVSNLRGHSNFHFIDCDLADYSQLLLELQIVSAKNPIREIWHLAANSDIPAGIKNSDVDFKDTFLSTHNILKASQALATSKIYFASSSAIYGDHGHSQISEDAGPLLPISNYGAMKLASEGGISAAAESYLDSAILFRFPNIVGIPATHGVILDFINKLKKTPDLLEVLGDGSQCKPYLHVEDLIEAMLFIASKSLKGCNVFNIGPDDGGVYVRDIAHQVVKRCGNKAQIKYGKGSRGWVGDVPIFSYSIDKIRRMGWSPKRSSFEAIDMAIEEILRECS